MTTKLLSQRRSFPAGEIGGGEASSVPAAQSLLIGSFTAFHEYGFANAKNRFEFSVQELCRIAAVEPSDVDWVELL